MSLVMAGVRVRIMMTYIVFIVSIIFVISFVRVSSKPSPTHTHTHTHTHNGILPSHKKNKIMPFGAAWMDLEIIILSEVSQKEKDKDKYMIPLICRI